MKLSTSWIKHSLRRTISDRELAEVLERAGIEVEQLSSTGVIDSLIVVGKVKKCMQHPNADRLRITEVQVSDDGPLLQIVCGAPNVREGLTVAVAQVGSTLPDGDVITKAKLRGEISHGMLCSGRELGLSDDHDGLIELDDLLIVGTPVADIYPPDGQIEFKTAANRPDLQSVEGIAREAVAQLGDSLVLAEVVLPELSNVPKVHVDTSLAKQITLAELNLGEANNESLRRYQSWLRTSNVRSISPVVDITNITMIETGQPTHAYDADKVQGAIVARMAAQGETLVTLDGKKRSLTPADLVIADDSGPIGLAGVMGGLATEVTLSTKRIYLEAACFDGATIRKAAQRHKLRSEASARFERGLPTELRKHGIMTAIALLHEYVGATLVSMSKAGEGGDPDEVVSLTAERLKRLVKDVVTLDQAAVLLPRLGYHVGVGYRDAQANQLTMEVPYWRPDVTLEEDVIEDLVKLVGYDQIPATLPAWKPQTVAFDYRRVWRNRVRDALYGAGLFEVHTYSFVSAEQLERLGEASELYLALENPMSQEQAYLRRSMLPSLLATLVRNEGYRPAVGLYEISGIFEPTSAGELPDEREQLAVIWQGRSGSYATLKGIYDELARALGLELTIEPNDDAVMAPGRSGLVKLNGVVVGRVGQLSPAVVRAHRLQGELSYVELDLSTLVAAARPYHYDAPSKFPVARRDLAIVVDQTVTWQVVAAKLARVDDVRATFLNDYYGDDLPEGRKSLAMRIALSAPDRTLTDAQVDERLRSITKLLVKAFDATVR